MGTSEEDLKRLGLAAAALMHDLQAFVGSVEEHAGFVVDELEAGRNPLAAARETLHQGQQVRAIIQDVLGAVSGSPAPSPPFDPLRVVHREAERAATISPSLVIRCRASLPGTVLVDGRRTLFERSVRNLLHNALRHARARVEVSVALQEIEGRDGVLVSVEDDGSGIAPELRPELFRAGVHGGHGGAGIGLASVAWAMSSLGGWVRMAEPVLLGGAHLQLWVPATARASSAPPADFAGVLAGRTVALLDDDASIRRVMTRLLVRAGARVITVDPLPERLEAVLAEIEASAPDVVLLDLHLGGLSGAAVWDHLHARSPEMARRVVFFSGAAGWSGQAGETVHGQPVIAKGLEPAELVRELDRLTLNGYS
ncbi:MAG: ATP-binding protein [Chloroflexota bacterium]|nr:ATP-binding protein [Chloroflexota bacterium]